MKPDELAARGVAERTPLETIAFAAWVNCQPEAIPPEYRQHTCEATMIAWRRVVTALMSPAALAASPEVAALINKELTALQDPLVVHLNMIAGKIAKPLPSQLVHIYGEDAIRTAFAALIREAEVRMVDRACLAVSERAEWPEDEHGRTEQPALFARVINAIRAEAAALKGETT